MVVTRCKKVCREALYILGDLDDRDIIFLSDRLHSSSGASAEELDEGLLDTVQQAGERFVRLVRMLEGKS